MQNVFNVSISPNEVVKIVNEKFNAKIAGAEIYKLENNKFLYISIYEKFLTRTNGDNAVILMCDNSSNVTCVKIIAAATGGGMFSVDFGAAKNLISSVREILSDYII